MKARPTITRFDPSASPQEAAAIVGALERYRGETAPVGAAPSAPCRHRAWRIAALREGVSREPERPLGWA